MTHPSDDHNKMTPTENHGPLGDDRAIERLLTGRDFATEPELAHVLTTLRGLGETPPRPPSAALAAVLADGLARPGPAHSRSHRLRRLALRTSIVLATVTGGVVTAATANALPAPAQRVVARVVEAVTSITLPQPHAQPTPQKPAPAPAPNTPSYNQPTRTPLPTPTPQPATATDNTTGATASQPPQAGDSQQGPTGGEPDPHSQGIEGITGQDAQGDAVPTPSDASQDGPLPQDNTDAGVAGDSPANGDNGSGSS